MGDLAKIQQRFTVIAAVLGVVVIALAVYLLWPGTSISAQEAIRAKLQKDRDNLKNQVNQWKSSDPEKTRARIQAFYAQDIPGRRSQIDERLDKLAQEAALGPVSIHYASDPNDKNDLPGVQRI